MLSMPSRTDAEGAKKSDTDSMIQPDMFDSLSTSAEAAATTPTVASPPVQSQMAQPTTPTISTPLRSVSTMSMMVNRRISRAKVVRVAPMASRACSSSRSPWANILTDWMLV
jgi:hypothetical protein